MSFTTTSGHKLRRYRIRRALAFALCALSFPSGLSAESVPKFIDQQQHEAEAQAEASKLKLLVKSVDSIERRGKVLLQIPEPGTEIGAERLLYLQVSNGLSVPDVQGVPQTKAEEIVRGLGLTVMVSKRRHVGVAEGVVASQVPPPLDRIDASREVVFLDVSSGIDVIVPNLVGTSLAEAAKILRQEGLNGVGNPPNPKLYYDGGKCGPSNLYSTQITGSSPSVGDRIAKGSTVSLSYEKFHVSTTPGNQCTKSGVPY